MGQLDKADTAALLVDASNDAQLMRELQQADALDALLQLHPAMDNSEEGRQSYARFVQRVDKGRRKAWAIKLMKYAAVLITGVVVSWTIFTQGHNDSETAMQMLSVPVGQRARLILADGSSVWVNSGSTLKYTSGIRGERRVELSGEATFNVAHDASRPFIVTAGSMRVRVLGTRFNVSAYPRHELSVSLMRGRVSVSSMQNSSDSIILKPGQRAVLCDGRYVIKPLYDNPALWTTGLMAFNNAPLTDIINQLETCYGVRIKIGNTRLQNYTYTGKFRQADGLDNILHLIQKARPFNMKKSPDGSEIEIY